MPQLHFNDSLCLSPILWKFALAYIDNIIVFSQTFTQHMEHLQQLFDLFQQYNLVLKLNKCYLCQEELPYLGHLISAKGMKPDPEKIKLITNTKEPKDITEVYQFLGLCFYY